MKNDPFSSLSGLDQRLFKDERQGNTETSKTGNKQQSGAGRKESSMPAGSDADQPSSVPRGIRSGGDAGKDSAFQFSGQAGIEARRTPVSRSSGHAKPLIRPETRHTYDIFQDQVRWMNRTKLDIEDEYGEKVTINGIVKLALDLLREDLALNGENSNLMRVLVFGKTIRSQESSRKTKDVVG